MSTKIYEAYRMPMHVFDSFITEFRRLVLQNAVSMCKKLMSIIPEKEVKKIWKERRDQGRVFLTFRKFYDELGDTYKLRQVFLLMEEASKKSERTLESIDCSINCWIYKNKVYVIPVGECWLWEGYKPTNGVEDYVYYNNTDHPEELTQRQWDARGKTWDKVCLDDFNAKRLNHEIIDAKNNRNLNDGLLSVASLIVGKDKAYIAARLK